MIQFINSMIIVEAFFSKAPEAFNTVLLGFTTEIYKHYIVKKTYWKESYFIIF